MSTRVPTLGARMPAIGATNIGASVHGVVCSAASNGVEPCTTCRYWIRMNTAPNVPKLNAKPMMLVTENERSRNRRSGTSGALARVCHHRNAASSAVPERDLGDDAERSPSRRRCRGRWRARAPARPPRRAPRRGRRSATRAPKSLLQHDECERDRDDRHGHVDPEDRLPVPALHDRLRRRAGRRRRRGPRSRPRSRSRAAGARLRRRR